MSYASEVLADSPALFLRLGETSGTQAADLSGNARHGTYVNAPATAAGPFPGDATLARDFAIGADQKITVPWSPFANGAARTYEWWHRRRELYGWTVPIGGDGATPPMIEVQGDGDKIGFAADGSHYANAGLSVGDVGIGIGQWAHVAFVFDESADTVTLYINGEAIDADAAYTYQYSAQAGNLTIGANGTSQYTADRLANVAIYPSALPAHRIRAHFQAAGLPATLERFPLTNLRDTFDRADESPAAGWSAFNVQGTTSSIKVASNEAAGVGAGWNGARYDALPDYTLRDCEAYATLGTVNNSGFIFVRRSTEANPIGYHVEIKSNLLDLWRSNGESSWTRIANAYAGTFAAGDQVGIRAAGNLISTWHKPAGGRWRKCQEARDPHVTNADLRPAGGSIGLGMYAPFTFADFSGGALPDLPEQGALIAVPAPTFAELEPWEAVSNRVGVTPEWAVSTEWAAVGTKSAKFRIADTGGGTTYPLIRNPWDHCAPVKPGRKLRLIAVVNITSAGQEWGGAWARITYLDAAYGWVADGNDGYGLAGTGVKVLVAEDTVPPGAAYAQPIVTIPINGGTWAGYIGLMEIRDLSADADLGNLARIPTLA